MSDTIVGSGEFRYDKVREAFYGRITIDAFEYPIEARPYEDGDGTAWRITVAAGKPYGPYKIPYLDQ